MLNGFTFYDAKNARDVFAITDAKKRTVQLAEKIAEAITKADGTSFNFEEATLYFKPSKIFDTMQAATLEKKAVNFRGASGYFYNISGEGFSGGTDFLTAEEAEAPEKHGLLIVKV